MKEASGTEAAVDAAFAAVLRAEAEALGDIERSKLDAAVMLESARRECTRIERRNAERLARWLALLELRAQQAIADSLQDPPARTEVDASALPAVVDQVAAQLTGGPP